MHSLFIDTTSGLTVGLLDKDFNWLLYENTAEKRPSEVLHEKVFLLLNKFNQTLTTVRLITIAGPGSYTGMRLSEGFSAIINWSGINVFSFYHFEVPQLIGVNSGEWVTNAFKKQFFCYKWDALNNSKTLLTHYDDQDAFTLEKTKELIRLNPFEIFSKVISLKLQRETYYFRTLEEEFGL